MAFLLVVEEFYDDIACLVAEEYNLNVACHRGGLEVSPVFVDLFWFPYFHIKTIDLQECK